MASYISDWSGSFSDPSITNIGTNLISDITSASSQLKNTPSIDLNSITVSSNYASGNFNNGGSFNMYGSGFGTYTPTINHFIIKTTDSWTFEYFGNLTINISNSSTSGLINHMIILSPSNENIDITGNVYINQNDASISNITYKTAKGTITETGLFTYHFLSNTMTGNLSSFQFVDNNNHKFQLSGINTPYQQLDTYTNLNSFVNGVMSGNDLINGTSSNDVLLGFDGNDKITGAAGNDTINGGSGINTARYLSTSSNYTITPNTNDFTVTDKTGANGTDTLISIERLQFTDSNIAIDINGNAGTTAKILGAVFGASSVSNQQYVGIGLSYLDGGMSYQDLMLLALTAKLGAGVNDPTQVVNLLYTNVVGVAPDQATLISFVGLLNSHVYTTASLGVMAADTSLNTTNINLVGLAQTGIHYV